MKILIAYDGSESARAAVDEMVARPWPVGTEVRIVTVLDRAFPMPAGEGVELYSPLVEKARDSLREEAYRNIRKALDRFKARTDLEASYEIRDGNVKTVLLQIIKEWDADLVVAGSHGHSGLARLFLGSVSHALVTHAPCSVEIVKARPQAA